MAAWIGPDEPQAAAFGNRFDTAARQPRKPRPSTSRQNVMLRASSPS